MDKLNWGKRAYTLFLLCATTASALPAQTPTSAQTFTTLHSFDNTDGDAPDGALVQATDGDLYGTTYSGGANEAGTVFKITPSGTLTTIYSFCSQSGCTDGDYPVAALVQATDGHFYGTTIYGGANDYGTVFKITPSGTLTTLYSFCAQSGCTDGAEPFAGVVQATDGNFYGTTSTGGANTTDCGDLGCGTVFKVTPTGTLTRLYSFCSQGGSSCTDGEFPEAALVEAADGNFYGTTSLGGAYGYGTVFKIAPSGTLTTLYSFCTQGYPCTDGDRPTAALVQATDGNLYGTTYSGGAGNGTIFEITPSGTLTTLYSFCSQIGCTDGENPEAGLVRATDGNFYGTTTGGGAASYGTVFNITPSGTLTTLYSFCSQSGCTDGELPYGGLVQDTNGTFYGTTQLGGASNACNTEFSIGCGTVFSLSVGLGPFLETQPTSGMVGAVVNILGTNLTGATSVTFNGAAAVFKVVPGGSEITTTVPGGATTGYVNVVTPSGTLSSNVPFQVTGPAPAPTSTSVVSSLNPSVFGQSVTFTATVTSAAGTPTGTVTFKDGSSTLGTGTLSSGEATFTTSALSVASHSITAVYDGSTDFAGSTSPVLTQIVELATSFTSLASSLNPSTFGAAVKFTATVTSSQGTPTGKVTLKNGSSTLGTGTLSSGKATFTTKTLSVASHSITAVYGGSTHFARSTSPVLTQTVKQASSSTSVASPLNPSTFGAAVKLTATVNSSGGTPTGTVTFKDGSSTLGTGALSSGKATFTTKTLSVGSHSITAVYGGSTDFAGSTSPVLTQIVELATSSASVASSLNPSTFGQSVTFTATVTSSGGTPTGTVTFKDGSSTLGTGTLSGGKAAFKTSGLTKGTHSITAVYGGSIDFSGSTSAVLKQIVN